MSHPIHHLEVKIERCTLRARVNDVPLIDLRASIQVEYFAPPINPYLVGEGNMVELELFPLLRDDGTYEDFSEVEASGAVRVFGKGDPVGPGEGRVIVELTVMAELAQRIADARAREIELETPQPLDVPQVFFFPFDNEGPAFEAELEEAPPLDDEQALRDYGMRLRDLLVAGDVSGLADEMAPKFEAFAIAYDDDAARIEASVREVFRDDYLPSGFETDFTRDELELEPAAGGRLWTISRPGGRELVRTLPASDGSTMQLAVIVGVRDEQLRIVR